VSFSLYDSAQGRIVPFHPIVPGEVSVYCCGLTVQSAPHLGHIRKEVVFDTLRRWLAWCGQKVDLIVNVTDVDDKILAKSAAAGRPWYAHAYLYELELHRATAALGCLPPTYEPRATGHIPEMVELVEAILANGHGYVAADGSGDVYFDVLSWPSYGELSGQRVADMAPAQDADPRGKRDPRDFALWKGHKPGEPATATWPSPWGRGRPGWHLECSAMAGKYLGDSFDIHGGGLDLRFPPHENELAQARAAGRGFARHWMHNAFVTDPQGEKMSKSLSNGMLVSEVVKTYDPRAVRFYLLAPHYRSMVEFSDQAVAEAVQSLGRLDNFVSRAAERLGWERVRERLAPAAAAAVTGGAGGADAAVTGGAGGADAAPAGALDPDGREARLAALPPAFAAALDADLGTPAAVAQLHDTAREGNRALDADDEAAAAQALAAVQAMLTVFGLRQDDPAWSAAGPAADLGAVVDGLVPVLLEQRQAARARRDYAAADAIRDRLADLGLTIEDTPSGPRWSR
jgi:cysteinyl-tRNA synthetase